MTDATQRRTAELLAFLANKWRARPAGGNPAYQLLGDAALGLVNLPTEAERAEAAAHLAGELVTLGVDAGLSLGELRAIGQRLGDALTEAIVGEVDRENDTLV